MARSPVDLSKLKKRKNPFETEEPQMSMAPPIMSPTPNKKLYTSTPEVSAPSTPEVMRDAETGELTGVVTPSGKRLFGLSPKDVKGLAETYASRMNVPAGTVDSEQVQQARMKQQLAFENQQLAGQVGTNLPEVPVGVQQDQGGFSLGGVNIGQALGEGAIKAGAGAAGGAIVGSVVPGVGNVAGLAAGAVGGFVTGVLSSIKRQLNENVSTKGQSISRAQTNLKALITDTRRNPQNAASNLEMFNYQLAIIAQEHSALKRETQRDLNKFLAADGNSELKKYELFYMPGGQRDFYTQQMATAILNPNLANVDLLSPEDMMEYEE